MQALRVCVVQNDAREDQEKNLHRLATLTQDVEGVDLIAFPEVCTLRGGREHYERQASAVPGPVTDFFADLARRKRCWVLLGSQVEKAPEGFYNTSVLFEREGCIQAKYRKIHLFNAYLSDGTAILESKTFRAGKELVSTQLEGWRCGLSICYDIRFPELYRHYSREGLDLLFIPANFTYPTGKAHWELLCRTRAVENQCFVVAPDLLGTCPRTKVQSYGHSLVVDPWGEVLLRGSTEKEEVLFVTLDPARLKEVRERIPALENRVL